MNIATSKITSGFTFYGLIPNDSSGEHIGIVLSNDTLNVYYCYCTSSENAVKHIIKHNKENCLEIDENVMKTYFPTNYKKTYIPLNPLSICELLLITFTSYLNTGEFEYRKPFPKNWLIKIFDIIRKNKSFPETLKNEIIKQFTDANIINLPQNEVD
jgi:hypothetical protein